MALDLSISLFKNSQSLHYVFLSFMRLSFVFVSLQPNWETEKNNTFGGLFFSSQTRDI